MSPLEYDLNPNHQVCTRCIYDDRVASIVRSPDDGEIDWSLDALDILRLINASNVPCSRAFCYLNNKYDYSDHYL